MKLKACAHLANHFCLMNSIPFPVLMLSNALSEMRLLRRTLKAYGHMSLKSLKAHFALPIIIISCF